MKSTAAMVGSQEAVKKMLFLPICNVLLCLDKFVAKISTLL